MDGINYDLIDKYLRKEMSSVESLNFEQEAFNNPELRKEIELTCRIKRCLTDRQEKLHRIAHWERKRRFRLASFATITSIAAMLVVGFFIIKPVTDATDTTETLVATTTVDQSAKLKDLSEKAIVTVKKSIAEGKEYVAIAEVTKLEEQNVIPTLNDVSEGRFIVSQPMETEDAEVLSRDAYELHWLKIQSLIAIGKNKEALLLLQSFVQVEGKYKASADSLLHTLN